MATLSQMQAALITLLNTSGVSFRVTNKKGPTALPPYGTLEWSTSLDLGTGEVVEIADSESPVEPGEEITISRYTAQKRILSINTYSRTTDVQDGALEIMERVRDLFKKESSRDALHAVDCAVTRVMEIRNLSFIERDGYIERAQMDLELNCVRVAEEKATFIENAQIISEQLDIDEIIPVFVEE